VLIQTALLSRSWCFKLKNIKYNCVWIYCCFVCSVHIISAVGLFSPSWISIFNVFRYWRRFGLNCESITWNSPWCWCNGMYLSLHIILISLSFAPRLWLYKIFSFTCCSTWYFYLYSNSNRIQIFSTCTCTRTWKQCTCTCTCTHTCKQCNCTCARTCKQCTRTCTRTRNMSTLTLTQSESEHLSLIFSHSRLKLWLY